MRCNGTTKTGNQCKNTQVAQYCHHHCRNTYNQPITFNFLNDGENIQAKPQLYCGSSLLLPNDYDAFGSRNTCLKKGVGIGMGMSDVKRYEFLRKPYVPSPQKLYCGDKVDLPDGYTDFGNLMTCLKKGVGAGLKMEQSKRLAFQSKPRGPLGKKELVELAQRLGISNVNGKTRARVEQEISLKIRR